MLSLIDGYRFGGAEILLAQLAGVAPQVDISMDIVSLLPESANARETIRLLEQAGVRPRNLNVRRLLDPTAIFQIVQEIRRSRCDIVHAHLETAVTLALPAAKLTRRPLVCTFHTIAEPLTGREAKRERLAVLAATRSDRAIFVSAASRAAFQHMYGHSEPPPNWEVIHNGVDLTQFTPGPADPRVREELGASTGPLVVVPGVFRDCKGIAIAIRAWPAVREKFPDAKLALVGDGEPAAEYRRQVDAAGLGDAVIFAGSRTDMPAVYRAADIILAPALPGENFPTTLIEASACGRPIVTTTAGGIPELVAAGETGLLVAPGDHVALVDAVCHLIEHPSLASRLGAAAVVRAQQNFSVLAAATNLRKLYESALGVVDEPAASCT
ncbi:hypothetical protein MPSYJ_44380 [Mycolicibacterium psychrotolerans]|uniref:Glycosyltransferase subfamily 4-like N-terminal domain-containing protein n=1 Tax=Mycolicibacterium psychrotolerans TaxID=216929 RepID=A0A7I7MGV2_9MYCO|nr:glycosyltransferase family 4 protein [Mycolicibacterium psychrotolerans]BBX70977.1 hypothetical protein MPSYJ_44380 [Mycolicibacterium psychrotolerans]